MKKMLCMVATVLLLIFGLCACNGVAPSGSTNAPPSGSNTSQSPEGSGNGGSSTQPPSGEDAAQPSQGAGEFLVVYFSYSGTTERVANEIARQLSVTATEIVPAVAYTAADTNYSNAASRNRRELANDLRPEISSATYDAISIGDYDTVIVGYPIWNGYEPMIIRTFFEHYNGLQGKEVYTFSTSASSAGSTAHSGIKSRYAEANVKENLHFTSAALSGMQTRIADWIAQNHFKAENDVLHLTVNGRTLTAVLADNSSARALKELLAAAPITIEMSDYGNFEKVGEIGTSLPRNDERITTEAGDLILYLGNRFVIYYDTNDWTFTRLGKIEGVSQAELKEILGQGNATVVLSLHAA